MSTPVEKVSALYPTQERVYLPLLAAVELLEARLAPVPGDAKGRQLVADAKLALARLDGLVPSIEEVLADFLDGCGPIESKFDRAQKDAWREGAHDSTITDSMCTETLAQVKALFTSIAPTARIADTAYLHVEAETPLLRQALDEAQADGWSRGDYSSAVREDLVERFMHIIATAALPITSYKDTQ